jgi:hypothetical protein
VSGVPQAVLTWANGDVAAETRVWRNGIVLTRVAPGVNTLTDIGIATDREYDYKVQHIRERADDGVCGLRRHRERQPDARRADVGGRLSAERWL